jgi:hypothetical protein
VLLAWPLRAPVRLEPVSPQAPLKFTAPERYRPPLTMMPYHPLRLEPPVQVAGTVALDPVGELTPKERAEHATKKQKTDTAWVQRRIIIAMGNLSREIFV